MQVTVQSKSGLHARPAGLLVSLAKDFVADIEIEKAGRKINGKSIMGILSLGTTQGDILTIHASGSDEVVAANALAELFNTKLAHE
jgi:phosphocarrier protein